MISLISLAFAAQIIYPLPDLGFCRDAKECYYFCEIPQNKPACWSYGKFVISGSVLGETDITFPVAELGNCASKDACFTYCNLPQNQSACEAFAQKHQLGRHQTDKQELLEKAKTALGCTSMESCQSFCEANTEKCMQFMRSHAPAHMRSEYEQYDSMMQQAKSELGCTSMRECQAICERPDSATRCQSFGQQYGSHEYKQAQTGFIETAHSTLGCDSQESCLHFCDDPQNSQKCAQFSSDQTYEKHSQESFTCSTEAECDAMCAKYPDRCPGYQDMRQEQYQQPSPYPLEKGAEGYDQYGQPTYSPKPDYQYSPPPSPLIPKD